MGTLSEVQQRIRDIAVSKDVIILAHNYQVPEVQDIADIVGDSLVLAMKATRVNHSAILFCGVDFMAEAAKVLSPENKVIHPVPDSQCPMAHMVDVEGLEAYRKEHPGAPVVAYVNTTAEIKAHADICCTSANAVKVVDSLEEEEVIFIPDSNLGAYVQSQLPHKKVHIWAGYCHVHNDITVEQIMELKKQHPASLVLVHPECTMEVIEMADKVASTEGMIKFAMSSDAREFIIGTEEGLVYRMRKEIPNKVFIPLETAVCPNMKKIGIGDVLKALEVMGPEIELDTEIIEGNKPPLERMLALK
ncbi:MAG: quinolinate synthase NadA [Candidatus Thermoplasmatota archaeon]|nr:quinolinate synthase NadA [Candidatus Thermoplasmatota archaeon]